ncbi:hypothetical protein [Ruegeria discodermiae]|uniref:hypothetical protein n=1 Tax=Ruegeria discodermiae TaxID=3064389 RepID=UPI0035320043
MFIGQGLPDPIKKTRQNLDIVTHTYTTGFGFAPDAPKQVTGVSYTSNGSSNRAMLKLGGEVIF